MNDTCRVRCPDLPRVLYFRQPSPANCVNASGVFAKAAAKDLTGCRNIGWPLAARNSSYYSTNIADRTESLRTEWRRTHPDGSCNFDLNGRHAVRRSKCRRALGRLGSAERLRQARRGPPEAELSRPLLSCQGRPRVVKRIVHPFHVRFYPQKRTCAMHLGMSALCQRGGHWPNKRDRHEDGLCVP